MNEVIDQIVKNTNRAAFLLGNGINLDAGLFPSWGRLVAKLSTSKFDFPTDGISYTELYDLIEMKRQDHQDLKIKVMSELIDFDQRKALSHHRLMSYAKEKKMPVLTTNLDFALPLSLNCKLLRTTSKGFTDFYPWTTYYGFDQHDLSTNGFGIWHIHGSIKYIRSIRLGLTDYMGSVEQARKLIHKGPDRLFEGKNRNYWKGRQTWLHVWFNMPLIIIGLGYKPEEVFLRWLLIERKRYFNIYGKPMNVWYLSKGTPKSSVANLLQNLGVEIVEVKEYDDIYRN